MTLDPAPKWLRALEKPLGWIAVPNIAILLVTCQVAGFLFLTSQPEWYGNLVLVPDAVRAGEYWRLVTFLTLPFSLSPIWALLSFWFLYFILNAIESRWGAFRTTLYVLISILVTIGFSFAFDYPITQIRNFQSTLFLAAACLFPEMTIQIFFVIPAKMKWMAWITAIFVGLELVRGSWLDRLHLAAVYSSFLLFFGPLFVERIRLAYRRAEYQRKLKG